MKQNSHKLKLAALVSLLCMFIATAGYAETVAWWRFEDGVAGEYVEKDVEGYNYFESVTDLSGNDNHLVVWSQGGGAGHIYTEDVPASIIPGTQQTNNLSVKNTGGGPAMFTMSDGSWPWTDLETIEPSAWTIEISAKPEDGGPRTLIGRDAQNVADDSPAHPALRIQTHGDASIHVGFVDVDGYLHEARSEAGVVQGFHWPSDPDGQNVSWYNVVAISDGSTLSLYVNEVDNPGWSLVAQTDMTESGSTDTSLTNGSQGNTGGGDWHAGGWSVARGLWNGGHADRGYGYVDEIRISTTALDPADWLFPATMSIETQPARYTLAYEGDTVELGFFASGTGLSYQWYRTEDRVIDGDVDELLAGQTDTTLVLTDVSLDDEGYYYCQITDTNGGEAIYTRVSAIGIARMKAHWPLDATSYVDGYYLDIVGGHDAAVNAEPNFIDGVFDTAVELDGTSGMANAGTWNPMQFSGQMTLSCWVNYGGVTGEWQKILTKRDEWNMPGHHWQLLARNDSNTLSWESHRGTIHVNDALHDDGQWQHIAVTFDGSTAKLYLDGELRGQTDWLPGDGPDSSFMIASTDAGFHEGLIGALDDVKVYNYPLEYAEIAELYYDTTGIMPCVDRPQWDITGDCRVGLGDFAELAIYWLHDGHY